MSQPQLVHIKRRKSEPHVDLLYVERPNKKKFTDQGYYFRRLAQEPGSALPATGITQHDLLHSANTRPLAPDRPPPVRATRPGDEDRDPLALKAPQHPPANVADNDGVVRAPPRPDAVLPTPPAALAPPERVRRFHLMRHRSLTPSALNPGRKRKSEIATFVERSEVSQTTTTTTPTATPVLQLTSDGTTPRTDEMRAEPARKRKRPNVRALRDRVREQSERSVAQPVEDPEELRRLAEDMARWALEVEDGPGSGPGATQKPTREAEMTVPADQDGQFVYDTFVQCLPTEKVGLAGNVGVLVIEEEDEEYWESYMDHEPDDRAYSDDEDSNAEDWYGNDYPEDEVDSDDEYDVDPYKYRDAGSDEEQYDPATWSDEEEARRRFESMLDTDRADPEYRPFYER